MGELLGVVVILFSMLTPQEQNVVCTNTETTKTVSVKSAMEKSKESKDTFCVTNSRTDRDYTKLAGYMSGKYIELAVSSSRLEERKGGNGCLPANIKIGYCSEVYTNEIFHIVAGTSITSKYASDLLSRRYGEYYYCEELSESQKYDQSKSFNSDKP